MNLCTNNHPDGVLRLLVFHTRFFVIHCLLGYGLCHVDFIDLSTEQEDTMRTYLGNLLNIFMERHLKLL